MRSLRVGVLLRDVLVEERVFDGPVTFGTSLRCALAVPADGLPREHVLFAVDEGAFVLAPLPGMTVKVVGGGAQGSGRLEKGARGKLVLGETTILFQDIARAVAAPRPRLPPEVRGEPIDRRLIAIVAASIAVHLGIAIAAWFGDVDTTPLGSSPVATRYAPAVDFEEQPLPAIPEPTTPSSEPAVATPIAPAHDAVKQHTVTPAAHIANTMPDEATLREQAIHMADLLSAPGHSPTGTPGDMANRAPGSDLAHQIDASKNVQVSIGAPTHAHTTDEEFATARKGTALAVHTPGQIDEQGPRIEVKLPTVHLSPVKPLGMVTTLTTDMVLDRITSLYKVGLQRCYQKGLLRDASLLGRVAITLTVDETGRVSDHEAAGSADDVDACIDGQMAAWRFAIPHDSRGAATEATFSVTLALAK